MKAEHPSPGLKTAIEHLPRPGGSVLDLGRALSANIDFFHGLGSRVRIADFDRTVDEEQARDAIPALWERKLPHLLPFHPGERFDLVLAWDLPNYFSRERWMAVARRITERLTPGGSFHLLVRVGAEMPDHPCDYRIVEPGILSEEILALTNVPPQRLPHADVEKLHPGLVAPRSHLGKHGMQEYVLEHAAAHNLPPRPTAQLRKRAR
ncbi:MAG: class I SAM-dependent methyltransferase [Thermoanaerobaculia bacterium]